MHYKNLHILSENYFFSGAKSSFDKYFPGNNFYLCFLSHNDKRIYQTENNVLYTTFSTYKGQKLALDLFLRYNFINLFVHYADSFKYNLVLNFKKIRDVSIYWIFFGADLYSVLENHGEISVIDLPYKSIKFNFSVMSLPKKIYFNCIDIFLFKSFNNYTFETFCKNVDYFCFWNEYDYYLLLKYFQTKAKFKYFIYLSALPKTDNFVNNKNKTKILINHNSSPTGNHLTIFNKLKSIGINEDIICPISYGDSNNAKDIKSKGLELFDKKILFIENYLAKEEYFNILSDVKVAIFGHRRQEGAANVFAMILNGSKVFLRNESSLFNWLKDRNFICFSFEDEMQSHYALAQLDDESIKINRSLYHQYFGSELIEENFFKDLLV